MSEMLVVFLLCKYHYIDLSNIKEDKTKFTGQHKDILYNTVLPVPYYNFHFLFD